MITIVKIAPTAMWCQPTIEFLKAYPDAAKAAGRPVRIDVTKTRTCVSCGGKEWFTPDGEALEALAGRVNECNAWICEHMLEMD